MKQGLLEVKKEAELQVRRVSMNEGHYDSFLLDPYEQLKKRSHEKKLIVLNPVQVRRKSHSDFTQDLKEQLLKARRQIRRDEGVRLDFDPLQMWRKARLVLQAVRITKMQESQNQTFGSKRFDQWYAPQDLERKLLHKDGNLSGRVQPSFRRYFSYRTPWDTDRELEGEGPAKCKCYISPESRFKKFWSIVLLVLLLYVATVMPFRIAFQDINTGVWFYVDYILDFLFFIDMWVNLFSAYYDQEENLVTSNRRILCSYLKFWFFIDLFACLPFGLIENAFNDESSTSDNLNDLVRLLRLPRLYRLLRITRLVKLLGYFKKSGFIQKIKDFFQINEGIARLMKFIMSILLLVHIIGCLWFFSAKMSNFDESTWVHRRQIEDRSDLFHYLSSVYWAFSTIATVGYGDIVAVSIFQKLISIVWMMVGVFFYSFTIGTLTMVLGKIDTSEQQLKQKLEVIDQFCKEAKILPELRDRIQKSLEYNAIHNLEWIDVHTLFNDMPPNLKSEIAIAIFEGSVKTIDFFAQQRKDKGFLAAVIPLLQPHYVAKTEDVYQIGDHPYEIYFIKNGRVSFRTQSGLVFMIWPVGSYFGEIEIFYNKKRIATATAEERTDLFRLSKKSFFQTLAVDFPKIAQRMQDVANRREEKMRRKLQMLQKRLNMVLGTSFDISKSIIDRSGKRTSRYHSMRTSPLRSSKVDTRPPYKMPSYLADEGQSSHSSVMNLKHGAALPYDIVSVSPHLSAAKLATQNKQKRTPAQEIKLYKIRRSSSLAPPSCEQFVEAMEEFSKASSMEDQTPNIKKSNFYRPKKSARSVEQTPTNELKNRKQVEVQTPRSQKAQTQEEKKDQQEKEAEQKQATEESENSVSSKTDDERQLTSPQQIVRKKKSELKIELTQEFAIKRSAKKNQLDLVYQMEKKQRETEAENKEMHVKLEKLSRHIIVLNNLIERLTNNQRREDPAMLRMSQEPEAESGEEIVSRKRRTLI